MARIVRKKTSSLAIVEKSSRGAIEEQYGNIIWLSQCMKAMGADHNLLLCGSAITSCLSEQCQQQVKVGSIVVTQLSNFEQSIKGFLERKGKVWVLESDVNQLDGEADLIEGVQLASSMAEVCLQHDNVWFW